MVIALGACRAVWVPGQNLAMLHLMRSCRKQFFVTTLYAIRTSTCMQLRNIGCLHVSSPRDIDSRVTLSAGPAGTYGDCCDHATMQACCNFCHKLGQYLETLSAKQPPIAYL